MTESYDEAVRSVMKRRRVDESTAALIVAEVYPALDEDDIGFDISFDDIDPESVGLVYHAPQPAGRVIPVDEERSPQGALLAQAERMAARREGDRYRGMGRATSMHTVEG